MVSNLRQICKILPQDLNMGQYMQPHDLKLSNNKLNFGYPGTKKEANDNTYIAAISVCLDRPESYTLNIILF